MQLNTYLNFDGNCEAAFNYYAQHLGGKVVALLKFGDSPMAGHTPAQDHDKVMHARFEVDGCALWAPTGRRTTRGRRSIALTS